jgi:hypothetical protein
MFLFRVIYIMTILFGLSACEVINSVTVGQDGETSFNAPLKPTTPKKIVTSNPSLPGTGLPVVNKPSSLPKPITRPVEPTQGTLRPRPAAVLLPSKQEPQKDQIVLPSLEGINEPSPSGSIMEGLSELTTSIFLTERESAGMPRVNGERISGDIYGENILIIKYTRAIDKIRYSDNIQEIKTLGQVEGSNAKVPYPTSFVKIFFKDDNDDSASKIFGIVQSD